jgi:hypothetical protein
MKAVPLPTSIIQLLVASIVTDASLVSATGASTASSFSHLLGELHKPHVRRGEWGVGYNLVLLAKTFNIYNYQIIIEQLKRVLQGLLIQYLEPTRLPAQRGKHNQIRKRQRGPRRRYNRRLVRFIQRIRMRLFE